MREVEYTDLSDTVTSSGLGNGSMMVKLRLPFKPLETTMLVQACLYYISKQFLRRHQHHHLLNMPDI